MSRELILLNMLIDDESEEDTSTRNNMIVLSRKRTHRYWVRNHIQYHNEHGEFNTLFMTLDEESFKNNFRMSRQRFYEIHSMIETYIKKKDTNYRKAVSTMEKFAVCVRYLATGDSFVTIANSYRLGVKTVSCIVAEVCEVLWRVLQPIVMPVPDTEMWQIIANEFDKLWQFKNCAGAMDGKHVVMNAPPNSGSSFFNYKKTFSIVMMCVSDANRRIVMLDVGSMGRYSDGGIFARSIFGKLLIQNKLHLPAPSPLYPTGDPMPFVFIGDEAFPLLKNLMRPYPGNQLDARKRGYNYRLSRARRIVENAFGVLSKRWRVYRRPFECNVETVDKVVKATCVLHNLLINDDIGFLMRNHRQPDSTNQLLPLNPTLETTDGFSTRESFCDYFNTVGKLTFQDHMTNRTQ